MNRRKRTVAKTFSWRFIATGTTAALVYAFTGELTLSLGVGLAEVVTKMGFYYAHERAWDRVSWGAEATDSERHPSESASFTARAGRSPASGSGRAASLAE